MQPTIQERTYPTSFQTSHHSRASAQSPISPEPPSPDQSSTLLQTSGYASRSSDKHLTTSEQDEDHKSETSRIQRNITIAMNDEMPHVPPASNAPSLLSERPYDYPQIPVQSEEPTAHDGDWTMVDPAGPVQFFRDLERINSERDKIQLKQINVREERTHMRMQRQPVLEAASGLLEATRDLPEFSEAKFWFDKLRDAFSVLEQQEIGYDLREGELITMEWQLKQMEEDLYHRNLGTDMTQPDAQVWEPGLSSPRSMDMIFDGTTAPFPYLDDSPTTEAQLLLLERQKKDINFDLTFLETERSDLLQERARRAHAGVPLDSYSQQLLDSYVSRRGHLWKQLAVTTEEITRLQDIINRGPNARDQEVAVLFQNGRLEDFNAIQQESLRSHHNVLDAYFDKPNSNPEDDLLFHHTFLDTNPDDLNVVEEKTGQSFKLLQEEDITVRVQDLENLLARFAPNVKTEPVPETPLKPTPETPLEPMPETPLELMTETIFKPAPKTDLTLRPKALLELHTNSRQSPYHTISLWMLECVLSSWSSFTQLVFQADLEHKVTLGKMALKSLMKQKWFNDESFSSSLPLLEPRPSSVDSLALPDSHSHSFSTSSPRSSHDTPRITSQPRQSRSLDDGISTRPTTTHTSRAAPVQCSAGETVRRTI